MNKQLQLGSSVEMCTRQWIELNSQQIVKQRQQRMNTRSIRWRSGTTLWVPTQVTIPRRICLMEERRTDVEEENTHEWTNQEIRWDFYAHQNKDRRTILQEMKFSWKTAYVREQSLEGVKGKTLAAERAINAAGLVDNFQILFNALVFGHFTCHVNCMP